MNTDIKITNKISANQTIACWKDYIPQPSFIPAIERFTWNARVVLHTCINNCEHTTLPTTWRTKTKWASQLIQKKHLTKLNTLSWYTQQTSNRRKLPQYNNGHRWKTHCQHLTQCWKTQSFSSKIRNKTGMPVFVTFIQNSTGSSS